MVVCEKKSSQGLPGLLEHCWMWAFASFRLSLLTFPAQRCDARCHKDCFFSACLARSLSPSMCASHFPFVLFLFHCFHSELCIEVMCALNHIRRLKWGHATQVRPIAGDWELTVELEISRNHLNGIVRHSCFGSLSLSDGQSYCIALE